MLNVFLGRKPFPNYRLVQPASGQLEKIIVKEDVSEVSRSSRTSRKFYGLILRFMADYQNKTLRSRCHSAQCDLRRGSLPIFHRSTRQIAPKYCSSEDACLYRYSRFRHHQRPVHIRSSSPEGHSFHPSEPDKGAGRRRTYGFLRCKRHLDLPVYKSLTYLEFAER